MLRGNKGHIDEDIIDMWQDGMASCRCEDKDKLYFADFQQLMAMKGRDKQRSSMVSSMVVGLQQRGSLRNYSSRRSLHANSEGDNNNTNSISSINDRMSSTRILSSTLAMMSALSPSPTDQSKSGGGENNNWARASVRSSARISSTGRNSVVSRSSTRSSSRSSIGSAGLLTVSRKSNLVPVAETTSAHC